MQQCLQNIHQSFLNIIVKRAREGLRRRRVKLYILGMPPEQDFRIHPELIVKSATFYSPVAKGKKRAITVTKIAGFRQCKVAVAQEFYLLTQMVKRSFTRADTIAD
jgi:hypothetical protein